MSIEFGKIESINLGRGGYHESMFGVSVTLSGKGWGVCDFKGEWDFDIKVGPRTQWTEKGRMNAMAEMVKWISGLMRAAKKDKLAAMKGVPVEVTFDDNRTLKSWRILTEVLP